MTGPSMRSAKIRFIFSRCLSRRHSPIPLPTTRWSSSSSTIADTMFLAEARWLSKPMETMFSPSNRSTASWVPINIYPLRSMRKAVTELSLSPFSVVSDMTSSCARSEPSVKAMSSKVNRFLIIVVLTSVCKDNNNFINVAKNRWSMMVMPMISGDCRAV